MNVIDVYYRLKMMEEENNMDENKHDQICTAYWDIYGRVLEDPEYALLLDRLEELKPQYEAVLGTLPIEAQEIIERVILVRESMASRMLECACKEMLFPEGVRTEL